MDVEAGNAWRDGTVSPQGERTGWFVGGFPEIKAGGYDGLRASGDVEIKWYEHPEGQQSPVRPISSGLTVSVLIEGSFEVEFCEADARGQPDENWRRFPLRARGDYLIWGPGLFHRWRALAASTVLSVRPTPNRPH